MVRVLRWLNGKPLRGSLLNIALFVALLAMIRDPALVGGLGVCAMVLYALPGLWHALGSTLRRDPAGSIVDRLLLWVPGALAVALCVGALSLIGRSRGEGVEFALGVALFALELSMLAVAASDLAARRAAASER